jgi:hypothetical protein
MLTNLDTAARSLLIKERRLTDLRAKQGRSAMFRTKGERDVYLKKQLSGVEKALQEKKKQVQCIVYGPSRFCLLTRMRVIGCYEIVLEWANVVLAKYNAPLT